MLQYICPQLARISASSAIVTVRTVALVTTIVVSGCGEQSPPRPTQAQPSEESSTQVGDFQLHYNTVLTASLSAEVAQNYGISRSKNRALLNISLLHKEAEHAGFQPISADVSVEAYNLLGQLRPIAMRRGNCGDTNSYIGEFDVSNRETLVFNIKATPNQTTQAITAKFKHEFFID
jgi:hypothetical protein